MLITTTSVVEGKPVSRYLGVVTGEAIIGANIFRDMFASIRDVVGGRSATYERGLLRVVLPVSERAPAPARLTIAIRRIG